MCVFELHFPIPLSLTPSTTTTIAWEQLGRFLPSHRTFWFGKISGLSLLLDLNPRICNSKAEWYFHQKDCSLEEVDFLITLWPLFHFAQNTEFTVFFHPVKNTFTNDVNLHSHKIDCSRTFELNLHQQFFLTHFIQCYIY